jgi:glucan phosphoethanolaminetransferase (alkaline phosphatase superfamily)
LNFTSRIQPCRSGKWLPAASVAVALITSYLAFNYWNKWKNTENNLTELIAQNQRVAQDYNTVNKRLDGIEKDLKITNNPAFNRVVMKGNAKFAGFSSVGILE